MILLKMDENISLKNRKFFLYEYFWLFFVSKFLIKVISYKILKKKKKIHDN